MLSVILPPWPGSSSGTSLAVEDVAAPVHAGRRVLSRLVDVADLPGLGIVCRADIVGMLARTATVPVTDANLTLEELARKSGKGLSGAPSAAR